MKWIALGIALCAIALSSAWIRHRPELARSAWTAFGLLPFLIDPLHLYMALRSWAFWPGYVKGIEITLLDLFALGLFFTLPSRSHPTKFKIPMLLYAAAVLLSCFRSEVFEISFSYLLQLGRMFFIYAIVSKASSDELISEAILRGIAIGIGIQAVVVIVQRFGLGELQTAGTFGHQNSLGIASHFVTFPVFALFLHQKKGWLGIHFATLVACIIVVILTVSRATIGLAAFGLFVVFVLSVANNWTSRKGIIGATGVLATLVLVPLALVSLSQRTNISGGVEYDERAAFESAATSIIADYPFGVGANSYVVVANNQGYNARAGVALTTNSLSAHVHNLYYLIAAETGWIGLSTYLLVLIAPLVYAFRQSRRFRNKRQGHLLLGLFVSLLIVFVHSLYEWVFITWSLQYFWAIAYGLIVGISRQAQKPPLNRASTVQKSSQPATPHVFSPARTR